MNDGGVYRTTVPESTGLGVFTNGITNIILLTGSGEALQTAEGEYIGGAITGEAAGIITVSGILSNQIITTEAILE